VKTQEALLRMLHIELWDNSLAVIADAKRSLLSDEPEALMLRKLGLLNESKEIIR
jgi:hypothetical protein